MCGEEWTDNTGSIILDIGILLFSQINFKIAFSIFVKDGIGFFIGIPFNPVDYYCYSHVLQSMNTVILSSSAFLNFSFDCFNVFNVFPIPR